MELLDAAVIFLGAFINVFLLGLQSRNVVAGRYAAAMLTSAGISLAQFIFVKFAATGSLTVLAISTAGGCLGIGSAIWFYRHIMERKLHMATKTANPAPKAPATKTPKEVVERVSKRNGATDVSKSKTPLRESGTTLPPVKKAKK